MHGWIGLENISDKVLLQTYKAGLATLIGFMIVVGEDKVLSPSS